MHAHLVLSLMACDGRRRHDRVRWCLVPGAWCLVPSPASLCRAVERPPEARAPRRSPRDRVDGELAHELRLEVTVAAEYVWHEFPFAPDSLLLRDRRVH